MAAPTVGAVMSDILPYLGVERQYTAEDAASQPVTMPDLTGLTVKDAQKLLKSLSLTMVSVGTDTIITDQLPAAGQIVPGGSQILAYLGDTRQPEMVAVPDFSGMTRQQASDAAGRLGLYILVSGNPTVASHVVVTGQEIPPLTQVPAGTTIKLQFTDTQVRD